jgi:hypothetical protein
VEHQGLIGTGRNIKTLKEAYDFEAEVYRVLRLKFDKNEWKFKLHTNKEIQDLIVDLYTCVYEKKKKLNDTITFEYVYALIAQNNGARLNWATYALATHEKKVSL